MATTIRRLMCPVPVWVTAHLRVSGPIQFLSERTRMAVHLPIVGTRPFPYQHQEVQGFAFPEPSGSTLLRYIMTPFTGPDSYSVLCRKISSVRCLIAPTQNYETPNYRGRSTSSLPLCLFNPPFALIQHPLNV